MVLILDHYDSFVFNLARYVEELGWDARVVRYDRLTITDIEQMNPSHLILSPGPCGPLEAGVSLAVVRHFRSNIPILGVCLGHQIIGHVFGAQVELAKHPMHGKASLIEHSKQGLFKDVPYPCKVGRYHSLIVSEVGLSPDLVVTARSLQGEVMAFVSERWKLAGVQFHPESILTEGGLVMLKHFLDGTFV